MIVVNYHTDHTILLGSTYFEIPYCA